LRTKVVAAGQQLQVDSSRAAAAVKAVLAYRRAASTAVTAVACLLVVFGARSIKLLSMYCCLLACELRSEARAKVTGLEEEEVQ
jgi:hypothetical protein